MKNCLAIAVLLSSCSVKVPETQSPTKGTTTPPIHWEVIEEGSVTVIRRTRTPTGWLVWWNGAREGGLTFVPDPDRKWLK